MNRWDAISNVMWNIKKKRLLDEIIDTLLVQIHDGVIWKSRV